jgi:hypothetical protein
MSDPHRLREARLPGLKRHIPERFKTLPKRVQVRTLTELARHQRRHVAPADAVLVTSSARSGSTWLFEMLASDPQFLPVFEPYHPLCNPRLRPFGDPLGQLQPPADPAAAAGLTRLVGEICAGRELTRWSAQWMPRSRLRTAPRTLVKDVSVNRSLRWVTQAVPVPTVLLIRHPCAVVESMMRTPWSWASWTRDGIEAALRATLRDVLDDEMPAARLAGDRARMLAAWWAVETRAALAALADVPCGLVVAYEDLVADPVGQMASISGPLGVGDLQIDADRPSHVTADSSPLRSGASPVDSWRTRLPRREATAIVDTAHAFGVALYTGALGPDRSLIPRSAGV